MAHTGGSKIIATLMNEQDLMKEKLSNDEILEEQSHDSVAWEGDVYSQVLGKEKSGFSIADASEHNDSFQKIVGHLSGNEIYVIACVIFSVILNFLS